MEDKSKADRGHPHSAYAASNPALRLISKIWNEFDRKEAQTSSLTTEPTAPKHVPSATHHIPFGTAGPQAAQPPQGPSDAAAQRFSALRLERALQRPSAQEEQQKKEVEGVQESATKKSTLSTKAKEFKPSKHKTHRQMTAHALPVPSLGTSTPEPFV